MTEGGVEVRRCEHIKTNGTQCGSPALREKRLCYFHEQWRTTVVRIDGSEPDTGAMEIALPPLEDASAIQLVVRQVTELLLRNRIDTKRAGQVLYAMQIAASTLKQINEEKPRAEQVVVDIETVGSTPIGMTPWSRKVEGHEVEDVAAGLRGPLVEKLKRELNGMQERYGWSQNDARKLAEEIRRVAAEGPEKCVDLKWTLNHFAERVGSFARR